VNNDSPKKEEERRAHKRYLYIGRATIGIPEGTRHAGTIVDLSMGGCLIRLAARAEFASHATVEVSLQSNYLAFRTMGSIRRYAEEGTLLGIAFQTIGARGRNDLRALILDLEAEQFDPIKDVQNVDALVP
jgi:c-di-GMP-binding flagellar brake protein YcgR